MSPLARNHRVGPVHAFIGNPNVPLGAGMTYLGYTRDDVTIAPNVNISTGRVDQIGTSGLKDAAWFGGLDPMINLPLVDENKDLLAAYMAYAAVSRGGGTAPDGALAKGANANPVLTASAGSVGSRQQNGTYTVEATVGGDTATARYKLTNPLGVEIATGVAGGAGAGFVTEEVSFKVVAGADVTAGQTWTFALEGVHTTFGFGGGFEKLDDLGTLALIPADQIGDGVNGVDAEDGVWCIAAIAADVGEWMYQLPDNSTDAMARRATQFKGLYTDFDDRPVTLGGAKRVGAERILIPSHHRILRIGSPNGMLAQTVGTTSYAAPAWSLPPLP